MLHAALLLEYQWCLLEAAAVVAVVAINVLLPCIYIVHRACALRGRRSVIIF